MTDKTPDKDKVSDPVAVPNEDSKVQGAPGVKPEGADPAAATPTPRDVNPNADKVTDAETDVRDADVDEDGGWIQTLAGDRIPRRDYKGG